VSIPYILPNPGAVVKPGIPTIRTGVPSGGCGSRTLERRLRVSYVKQSVVGMVLGVRRRL
jgi:hypothetical protein